MRRYTPHQFIAEASRVHSGRYSYPGLLYVHAQEKVEISCPEHGVFEQSPYKHLSGQGCPKCKPKSLPQCQPQPLKDFISKGRKIHGDRYDYSKVNYKNNKTPVTIICREHREFTQTPASHTHKTNPAGCPSCACTQWTTALYIERVQQVHDYQYNYSETDYSGMHSPVRIICQYHGPFDEIAYVHLNGSGCPKCRNSYGHTKILRALSAAGIPYSEEYGIREPDARMPLRLDFAILRDSVPIAAVEYHGEHHYKPVSFGGKDFDAVAQLQLVQERDERKRAWCKTNNVPLLEISYQQLEQAGRIAVRFASSILADSPL